MDGCKSNGKKENCPDGLSNGDSCDSSDDDSSDKGYTNRGDFVDVAEVTSGKLILKRKLVL